MTHDTIFGTRRVCLSLEARQLQAAHKAYKAKHSATGTNRQVIADAVVTQLDMVIQLAKQAGLDAPMPPKGGKGCRRPHNLDVTIIQQLERHANPIKEGQLKRVGPPAFSRDNLMRACLCRYGKKNANIAIFHTEDGSV